MEQAELRLATTADLDQIMVIVQTAQRFIAKQGFDQWQNGYPAQADMLADIKAQRLYVLIKHAQIAAFAAVMTGIDPNYRLIEQGAWLTNGPYVAIHRVAVADGFRGQHIGQQLFKQLFGLFDSQVVRSVRVDTHPANQPMQHLVQQVGFIHCGTIYIDGIGERRAFELVLDK